MFEGGIDAVDRPVDLSLVESDFQRRAYSLLRKVPAGAVITYQGLAAAAGNPDAQRAIGTTMATNPIPIFVPCHRVINPTGPSATTAAAWITRSSCCARKDSRSAAICDCRARAVMGHRHTQNILPARLLGGAARRS